MSANQQLYEVAIGLIPGVGSYITRQLVSYCGSAENVFKEKKGKLLKVPGVGKNIADAIVTQQVIGEAEKELLLAEKCGVEILFFTSKSYPQRLKSVADAPALLYYKGNTKLNAKKIISVVGTRKATEYGKESVDRLIKDLCAFDDVIVVSGLAYGIDIAAHKASLVNNIPTVAVMAAGIDVIYPSVHKEVAKKIVENGALLTEYPMGSSPEPARFPARNRIIAGIADVVLVVEAAAQGGALITAEIANSYNREVFAVPGNNGNKFSEGCNKLIRDHKANIYTSISDIEYLLNWSLEVSENKRTLKNYDHLDQDSRELISFLQQNESLHLDDLSWQSQVPLSRLASLLLNLEFAGIVKSLPGKKYKLVNG